MRTAAVFLIGATVGGVLVHASSTRRAVAPAIPSPAGAAPSLAESTGDPVARLALVEALVLTTEAAARGAADPAILRLHEHFTEERRRLVSTTARAGGSVQWF